jgi:hypothetical protein
MDHRKGYHEQYNLEPAESKLSHCINHPWNLNPSLPVDYHWHGCIWVDLNIYLSHPEIGLVKQDEIPSERSNSSIDRYSGGHTNSASDGIDN